MLIRSCDSSVIRLPLHCSLDEVVDVVWPVQQSTSEHFSAQKPLLQFLKGSHRSASHHRSAPTDSLDTRVLEWCGRPGIFLGSTLRRYLPEQTPYRENFKLLKASYHTAYLHQRSNLYLQFPPNVAIHPPPPIQRLLGYGMHALF